MACNERVVRLRARLCDGLPSGHEVEVLTIPVPAPVMAGVRDKGHPDVDREERFLQLFLANERRIYAFILTLVPVWSDAEDLLQETTSVMWRKLDEFEPGSNFVAWALKIARFEVLNFRKKRNRDLALFSDQTDELLATHAATRAWSTDERRDELEVCLTKLNDRDRELIRLRYQPDVTTQDVADRVGRSLKAVYKALNRIHEQLLLCIRKGLASKGC